MGSRRRITVDFWVELSHAAMSRDAGHQPFAAFQSIHHFATPFIIMARKRTIQSTEEARFKRDAGLATHRSGHQLRDEEHNHIALGSIS
jgi:hypothetical protein